MEKPSEGFWYAVYLLGLFVAVFLVWCVGRLLWEDTGIEDLEQSILQDETNIFGKVNAPTPNPGNSTSSVIGSIASAIQSLFGG